MYVDRDEYTALLCRLVRTPSINPAFTDGETNEREIAARVADEMRALGMEATNFEPEPGRVSVLGRLAGAGGGPSLMLYAHMDTVDVSGMDDPFTPVVRDGRVYGRGAYDMKGGLAACLAAVRALRDSEVRLRGDLLIAAVADEEVASIGMADLLRHVTADAAIVTEPTEMRICQAHKGFVWLEVDVFGRAAHGSRFQDGIDANLRMGRVLARLETLERELRASPPHPLVGPPSLHAAVLRGGTGPSTYAAHCRLEIERRTIPGETEQAVVAQVRAITDALAAEDPTFRAEVRSTLARGSFEAREGSPVARAVGEAAAAVLGEAPPVVGEPYWMDTALIADAGIDVVAIGARGAGAHAAVEWADVDSHVQLTEILARAAAGFCGRAE